MGIIHEVPAPPVHQHQSDLDGYFLDTGKFEKIQHKFKAVINIFIKAEVFYEDN